MNRSVLFVLTLLLVISCGRTHEKEVTVSTTTKNEPRANEYTEILRQIHETYLSLSGEVEKRSANLSELEKQRAAMFLTSAFDLVMESYVYKGDPANPAITEWMSDYRKFGGDNPHTIYSQIPVDDHYTYVLKGRLGNAIYFGIQVYGFASGFNLPTANLNIENVQLEADGSFELYLSETKPEEAKNWIPLKPGDHAVLLRQYFEDGNDKTAGKFTIERVDTSSYVASTYLDRLKRGNDMMTEYIKGTLEVCDLLQENALNNYAKPGAEVRAPKYGGALYPTKDNKYEGFWVSLKEGEAIHLHGILPQNALYASYVFYDRWYVSPDYRSIQSFLTDRDIQLNEDGSFDIYISPEKINHPNWIDTGGLYEGSFSSRYLLSESSEFPKVELIKIASIAEK